MLDVDQRSVRVCAQTGNGEEVGIGKKLLLEVFVPSECFVENFIGLTEDIVIYLLQMLENEFFLLLQHLIIHLTVKDRRMDSQCVWIYESALFLFGRD